MAILSFPPTFMLVCAFAAASAMTPEDALAAQRLHEHAPPELQEVFQQLLQESDFDEAGQFFQHFGKEQDLDEDEEVEEKEETGKQEAKADGEVEEEEPDEWDVKDEEGTVFTEEQEAKDKAEETSEDMSPEMLFVVSKDPADLHGDGTPNVNEATDDGMDLFGDPWAFVADMQSHDFEIQTKEMTLELPHVGEVGAKNTRAHDGEPLMIQDVADASAARSFNQPKLLQMNQFSFNGNVLNRSKNAEDDVAHWIVQFCPHWWDPCVGLTDAFAKVGRKLEEQINTALFTRNIRFATVDCASEKVLCNQQEVETYPTTRHYYNGEFVAGWFGGQAHHEEFYTQWLIQQAQGITTETPAGYVVGNITNGTKGAQGSKEKEENEKITLPTFEKIATDLILGAVLIALCTQAVLCNGRLWQGSTRQLQQQQHLPQRSTSPHSQGQHETQELPKKAPHNSEHCRQRSTSRMPGAELRLPSSWNKPARSMEL